MSDNAYQAPGANQAFAPVGTGNHTVAQGECLNHIAEQYGFFWKTLWELPQNKRLRDQRLDHNILFPDDRVFIPEKRIKKESAATDQRHRFRRKGVPSYIKIQLLEDESPETYANQPYTIEVGDEIAKGVVDNKGYLSLPIRPGAKRIILTVGEEDGRERFELDVGMLNPIGSPSGAQQRLLNLGYFGGPVSAVWQEEARAALANFQAVHFTEEERSAAPGTYDQKTQDKLVEIYGC